MLENLVFETQLSICQSISHTHTHTHTDIYMKRHIYMKNIYLRYKGVWYTTEMHIYSSDILYILTYIFKISFRFSYVKVTQLCLTLLQPNGLYSPWNSPGQNTGVGSISLLQRIFPTQGSSPGLLYCRRILYQLSHKESHTYTLDLSHLLLS